MMSLVWTHHGLEGCGFDLDLFPFVLCVFNYLIKKKNNKKTVMAVSPEVTATCTNIIIDSCWDLFLAAINYNIINFAL